MFSRNHFVFSLQPEAELVTKVVSVDENTVRLEDPLPYSAVVDVGDGKCLGKVVSCSRDGGSVLLLSEGDPSQLMVGSRARVRRGGGNGRRREHQKTPVNPVCRVYPKGMVETGMSVIDAFSPLAAGVCLPIFSLCGLPHVDLALQLSRQFRVNGEPATVVVASVGADADQVQQFASLDASGNNLHHGLFFLLVC